MTICLVFMVQCRPLSVSAVASSDCWRLEQVRHWTLWVSGPCLLMRQMLHSVRSRRRLPVPCGHWIPLTPAIACTCTPCTHQQCSVAMNGCEHH